MMNLGISRLGANFAKDYNRQTLDLAKGLYEMPATVPQFMAGGGLPAPIERTSVEEDDVPAMLNKHEVVIPADVARYIGVEKINKMVINARKAMEKMEGPNPEEPDGGDEDDMTKYGMTPPPVIGGVAHAANGIFDEAKEKIDQFGKAATKTYADVKQAAGQALDSVKSSSPGYYAEAIKKGAGPGFAGLYATGRNIYDASAIPSKILTTVPEPVKQFFSPGEVLPPGLNKPAASAAAQVSAPKPKSSPAQAAPTQGAGLSRESKPLNILGQPVQTLDERGGYKVYGPNGETAVEIPWSSSDDSALRRTLTADEYKDRQLRVADYNDQKNAAVIAENGNFAPNYLPASRGDGSLGLGLARLDFEQGKYLEGQQQAKKDRTNKVLGKYNEFVTGGIGKNNEPVPSAYDEPLIGQDGDQYVKLLGTALAGEGLDPSPGTNALKKLLTSGAIVAGENGQFSRLTKDESGNDTYTPFDLGELISYYYNR